MNLANQGRRAGAALAVLLLAGCPNLQGIPALGSPSPINFGTVSPGAGMQTRQIVIQNIGGSNLGILKAVMGRNHDGTASSQLFSVGQPTPTSLSPGENAVAEVRFSPLPNSASGAPNGLIQITTDSSYTPLLEIPVLARVETPPALPSLTLDFGAVPVQTRKTLSLQITAARAVASPVLPTPTGTFQTGLAFSDGGLFEQEYSFIPTAAQSYQAEGTFVPCAGCAAQQLILKGQGIYALVFQDLDGGVLSSFDMGTVVVGVDAGYRVQLVNQWSDQVTLDGLNDVSPFSASASAIPRTMNPGQPVDVELGFAPTEAGFESASLFANYQVGSEALASAPLALLGRGISDRCDLSWSPPSVFFGYAPANLTVHQQVTFINHGAVACTVANFSIFPGGAAEPFMLPVVGPITVDPRDGSALLPVDFKPAPTLSPIHQRGATLIFDTGDPLKPDAGISLSGSLQLEAYGASAWPKWHHDNGNTGLSPVDTSSTLGVPVWTKVVGSSGGNLALLQGPSLDETGAIYVLADSNLLKRSPTDGTPLGTLPVQASAPIVVSSTLSVAGIESTPTIISGSPWLSIATSQGADAGRILTSSGVTLANLGSSAPIAGFVGLNGGFDGGIYIADDQTSSVLRLSGGGAGLQRWDLCGGGSVCALETFSGALADDGTSYWTGGASYAFALAADGTNLWSRSLSGGATGLIVHAAPALLISDGVVYGVGSYQHPLDGGVLYGSSVYALNQADGVRLWEFQLPMYDPSLDAYPYPIGYASPALRSDGTVVVGYRDGVYLISPQGQLISMVHDANYSGVIGSAAIGSDGTIYIGTLGGVLMAIDDKGCDAEGGFCTRWIFAPGGGSPIGNSPAIGADGTIYLMAGGQIFALQ